MITSQALHGALDQLCRRAAALAFQRIEGYDLNKVTSYLDMLKNEEISSWKHGEIIATIEARTLAGCPDNNDSEQLSIMEQCFNEAGQSTA